ncbi:MAG: TonB-dependent receptor [Bacteroidales bacterium]|nr:TonB-dependent receptor [Bacteroidales bacterium]MBR1435929.1 TonB-dependent receptor [Bacteroidales bacterium]
MRNGMKKGSGVKYLFHLIGTASMCLLLGIGTATAAPSRVEEGSAEAPQNNRITVKGVILDEQGQPVLGASVFEKGNQSNGTVADIDGNFEISVPAGSTLVFSSIGYATVEMPASSSMRVVLREDSTLLEETVVVGYGVQKKQSLTGAIAAIKADDIVTTKTESLVSDIQGKMPGLLIRQKNAEPGSFDNMISIRGYGSPLFVIDGIVRSNEGAKNFAQLNPDDIESISILKDASAAIYGMNAANGVIIVTTKQGREQKTSISYSALFGLKQPTGMERTVDAYTYRVIANEMSRNVGQAEPYSQEVLDKYKAGVDGYKDWDWIDMYLKKAAFQQNHNISVQGGTGKINYFVGLGYNQDDGLIKSNIQWYKRYTLRSNLSVKLAEGLTMNLGMSGRVDNTQRAKEEFLWTFKTLLVNDRGVGPFVKDNPDHLSKIGPEDKNPDALVRPDGNGYRRNENINYDSNLELKWELPWVKGLTLSALGSYDGFTHNDSQLSRSYQIYDYFTDDPQGSKDSPDSYSNTIYLYHRVYGRLQGQYMTNVGDHNFNVMVAAEASASRNDSLNGSRQYTGIFTNDILDQADSGTAQNWGNRGYSRLAAYLGRFNYDYAGKYLVELVGRYDGSYRYAPGHRWAFFPSASIGWRISQENFVKNNIPWLTNLKLRASYGLSGMDAGNAFAYVYGYSKGGANTVFGNGGSSTTAYVAPGMVTDELSWVTSKIMNAGLDAELWGGKLFGTFEVFKRHNTGLLASRAIAVPNTFGASFPEENLNSDYNYGFELELGTRGQIGRDWKYSVSANYTYARYMYGHREGETYSSSFDKWQNGQDHRTMGSLWWHTYGQFLAKYDGQYQSIEELETAPLMNGDTGNARILPGSFRILDLNGDGVIDYNDQVPEFWAKGSNPPMQYGLNISLSWKNLDLNMLWQGASGYRIVYANDDVFGYLDKTNPTLMQKYMDRWHTANITDDPYDPSTKWIPGKNPALRKTSAGTLDNGNSWGTGAIDFWNPDATYLRLKSLEIGYNLPKSLLKKLGMQSARFYLNGFNLLTFCNSQLKNADPEREENSWDASLAYPLMKTYNFGFNITF